MPNISTSTATGQHGATGGIIMAAVVVSVTTVLSPWYNDSLRFDVVSLLPSEQSAYKGRWLRAVLGRKHTKLGPIRPSADEHQEMYISTTGMWVQCEP